MTRLYERAMRHSTLFVLGLMAVVGALTYLVRGDGHAAVIAGCVSPLTFLIVVCVGLFVHDRLDERSWRREINRYARERDEA